MYEYTEGGYDDELSWPDSILGVIGLVLILALFWWLIIPLLIYMYFDNVRWEHKMQREEEERIQKEKLNKILDDLFPVKKKAKKSKKKAKRGKK
jgi:uncharacterized membrane protein